MPLMNHPRSSDSHLDFEHAVTLKELEELTRSEKEYVSPREQLAVSLALFEHPPSRPPSSRTSRSTSSTSGRSRRQATDKLAIFKDRMEDNLQKKVTEKLAVFRDEVKDGAQCTSLSTKNISPMKPKQRIKKVETINQHLRAKSDSAIPRTQANMANEDSYFQTAPATSASHDLINQLQRISDERTRLLQRLQRLNQQESSILAQLAQPAEPPHSHTVNIEKTTIGAPTLLSPILDPIAIPIRPPTKMSSSFKRPVVPRRANPPLPQLPRPVSAPAKSMPTDSRKPTSSAPKRVPLTDKTEESLAMSATDSTYISQRLGSSHIDENAQSDMKLDQIEGCTPTRRGRSVQVAVNFGDNDLQVQQETSIVTPSAASSNRKTRGEFFRTRRETPKTTMCHPR